MLCNVRFTPINDPRVKDAPEVQQPSIFCGDGVSPETLVETLGKQQSVERAECPLCAKSRYSALRQGTSLFDHLIGDGEHAGWNGKAKCFRRLEVDDKVKPCRLLDW